MKKVSQSISTLWQKYFARSSAPSQIFLGLKGENVLESPKNPNETKSLSVSLYEGHSRIIEDINLPITKNLLDIIKQFPTLLEGGNSRKAKSTENEQTSSKQTDSSSSSDKIAERLENVINELTTGHKGLRIVRDKIRDKLVNSQSTFSQPQPEFFIQYKDPNIAQIPFHKWEILESFEIEPVFSEFNVKPCDHSYSKRQNPRILIILGNAYNHGQDNLDLQVDIEGWKDDSLPNVDITIITPLNYEAIDSQLWEKKWDILYFAGHSDIENGETLIELNNEFKISLKKLQEGLKIAVKKGLKLAIFNSCVSLGAAADLHQAGVPAVIAMRYEIPDVVAHTFLKFFLQEHLNGGKSVSAAVQRVRKRFKGLEDQGDKTYKFASWLPVVFQIPGIATPPQPSLLPVIATSFFVTCLVFFLHTQGIFQSAELSLYDHMMNSRKAEPLDSRIMVVQTTAEDRTRQEQKGNKVAGRATIDDELMLEIIKKLDEAQPKVIGLTYWRDNAQRNSIASQELFERIISKRSPVIVANCTSDSNGKDPEGFAIPPEHIPDKHPHIGFTNSTSDSKNNDDTIRRLLLVQNAEGSKCSKFTNISLSLRLVLDFLGKEISYKNISSDRDYYALNIGDISMHSIRKGEGGYQVDPIGEVNSKMIAFSKRLSILFKFKNHESDQIDIRGKQIFSAEEVMSGDYKEKFKDKIIIIGGVNVNSDSFRIYSGKNGTSKIYNLFIHAQAVDYLLRVFEGGNLLKGFDNKVLFLCYIFINTFTFLYVLFHILTSSINHKFYSVILLAVAFPLLIYYIHLYLLGEISIWMPSIPILVSIFLSSVILVPQLAESRNLKS